MTEWQPIETAPKDRQIVLRIEWDGRGSVYHPGDLDVSRLVKYAIASWHAAGFWNYTGRGPGDKPTHWMPLPELPG